jgi:hypothetical protein
MFTLEGPHIVMSRTDGQNGLDFHFNIGNLVPSVFRKVPGTEVIIYRYLLYLYAVKQHFACLDVRARSREKIWPAMQSKLFRQVKYILACHFYSLNCQNGDVSYMSHIVKINVFMICIFTIFKLVYFTTVNLYLHFKYINVFSQLNDLVTTHVVV